MLGENQNHTLLCMGCQSYAWDICLMYGILDLCFEIRIICRTGATMAECIVLCMGYQSHVWDICSIYGILLVVFCSGDLSYVWDISLMFGIFVLCMGY